MILLVLFFVLLLFYNIYCSRLILYKDEERKIYYIPEYYAEKQIEDDKLYVFLGFGYENLFSFRHIWSTHWWEGAIGTYLVIENSEITQSLVYIEMGDDINNKKVFSSNVSAEIYNDSITNIHLLSEDQDGKKIEYYLKEIDLRNVAQNESIEASYFDVKAGLNE